MKIFKRTKAIVNPPHDISTEERILLEAAKLFATKSYDAVSMREIAKAVGIKPSSIYNYFIGKDDLLEEILNRFTLQYTSYFDWLAKLNAHEDAVEKVIENMFIKLHSIDDIFTYYGIAIVLKEQFHNEMARKLAFKLFHSQNIDSIQSHFDRLVQKKLIPPCDSNILATCLMYCVLIGTELKLHESMGQELPIDCDKMYDSLCQFMIRSVKSGAFEPV